MKNLRRKMAKRGPTTFLSSDKPLTVPQLAEWLQVSRRYLNYEMESGRLRRTVFGTHLVRLLPDDINAWLNDKASNRYLKKEGRSNANRTGQIVEVQEKTNDGQMVP